MEKFAYKKLQINQVYWPLLILNHRYYLFRIKAIYL